MADVILFHHARGLTPGVEAFAQRLRDAGHAVVVPDLYDGALFDTTDAGVAHAEEIGFEEITARGVAAAAAMPDATVYAGFSMGALPAQKLAQTRPGALGALLYHAAIPLGYFGDTWPDGVALQMHVMEGDDWGDVDVAQELAAAIPTAELFLYPGSAHLFTDSSVDDYDADAAARALERTLEFLNGPA